MSNDHLTLPSDQNATGRTFGPEELENVAAALRSGTLTSTKGEYTKQFEQQFASQLGSNHGFACASGTAAIHTGTVWLTRLFFGVFEGQSRTDGLKPGLAC